MTFNDIFLRPFYTRHFFVLAFLLSTSIFCYSQTNKYHPFLHEGGKWSILKKEWETGLEDTVFYFYLYCTDGDTIVDGKTFFRVKYVNDDTCSNLYNALLREDTITKKIYYYRFDVEFEGDTLLYDFSVVEGQSLSHCITFAHFDSSEVSSIDSIFLDGNYRKKFNILFYVDGNSDSTFWIEGIGAVFGPAPFSGQPEDFGYGVYTPYIDKSQIICYKENLDVIYDEPYWIYNCAAGQISINNFVNDLLTIYPNPCPSGQQIIISNEGNIQYDCEIISITGKLVNRFAINGNYEINTSTIPTGYYYITFKSYNNVYVNTFIIL
ncbi:MAG TPA: T9SS type A sorting domain-containing protein [Chitinophagales bacterium]|nr:T9SS type A sorting domain-containing protein [Chitinophagales bacterium]HRG84672.1 T9SS type A sorting domain-containing protein [Chitinophagales bacterium]